jgi:pre-rRNA-processing protein TSR3
LLFLVASPELRFDATGYILLDVDAPPLTAEDGIFPLLLLDSTWRLLPQLQSCVQGNPMARSLPAGIKTAYPRRSKVSADPEAGLASVEALYAARLIQARSTLDILDHYHWKSPFLSQF